MKKFGLLAIFLVLIISLAACNASNNVENTATTNNGNETTEATEATEAEAAAPEVEQVFLIGAESDPVGLDPHTNTAHSSTRVINKVYEGLVETDDEMNFVSSLAESWTIENDMIYTFKLKEGVKFHNGREMTAEDVKYSFERILNPDTAAIAKSYFDKVSEINVIDTYTVEFVLSEPFAPFLSNASSIYASIVAKEIVEENGDLNTVMCGTGPFIFDSWTPDNEFILVKNEEYRIEGQPKLDTIKFLTMTDESSRLAALRSGAIHMTILGAQNAQLVKNNDDINVVAYESKNYTFLGFNMNIEPFNNIKVRQALSIATNRQELIDIVYKGEAVLSGPVPPAFGRWSYDVSNNEYFQYDVEKAKALLAEAGYPDGFTVEITALSSVKNVVDTAVVLQQQWAEIGVDVTVKQLEIGQYVDAWKTTDHQVMAGLNGSGTDPDRAVSFFFNTEGSANVWGFSDAKIDELTNLAKITTDEEVRVDLYLQAQERLFELSPNLFFSAPMSYNFVSSNIAGYAPNVFVPEDLREVIITE